MRRTLFRLALACACVLLLAPPAFAETVERSRWLMGTLFTVRADGSGAIAAVSAALDTVASLESRLSNWRATSELSRLNASGEAEVSEPLAAVIDSALALAALTGGAFDPTVEPLTLAWHVRGKGHVPTLQALADARARVNWQRVHRDGARVALGGAALDLGGIGKGFALDRAAAVLTAHGIADASLDAGGQRLDLGVAPSSVWVAHPERRETPVVRVLVRGGSLSTSAQSERSVRAGGRRIGHVLDPRTGQPLATAASVSVWAPSGTRADALSTALLVLGRDAAAAFASAHPDVGVLWIEPAGHRLRVDAWNIHVSEVAREVELHVAPPFSPTLTSLTGKP